MKHQAGEKLGHHMDKMAGILVQPWNITDAIRFTSPKQEETELWKQLKFSRQIHLTISFISRFGHSGRSGSQARTITSATGGTVLSGRQRTNNRFETTGQYSRRRKTKLIENYTYPHRQNRKYCTSEGANRSFTSEGGRHRRRATFYRTHHIITLNTKFTSQAKNTHQTYSHTTNTSCHGATQCPTKKIVPRYDG
jgi:hypothetical protein